MTDPRCVRRIWWRTPDEPEIFTPSEMTGAFYGGMLCGIIVSVPMWGAICLHAVRSACGGMTP
jgi:hypothetical protein